MRTLDRLLQRWRIIVARPWIPQGARVLDIGCYQGELFKSLGSRLGEGVGIDPLARPAEAMSYRLLPIQFSVPLPFPPASFDVVTMLAVLEHIEARQALADECRRILGPHGRMVITVPHPRVERILELLLSARLVDGMSLEQHHGYDPSETYGLFTSRGFALVHHSRFQFGLNHLFVFRRWKDGEHVALDPRIGHVEGRLA